ncbi:MAG: hypothetical protein ACR2QG_09070 [Gammaproteobacteria bacterium]
MEKLPLTVGVLFNEELSNYIHVEDPMMDSEWTIDIGQANVDMYRALFTGMFSQTLELNLRDDGTPDIPESPALDAVIEPRIEDFEFSVPRQSGNDQFTVWVKYKLRMTKPDGERIGDWRVTGYGQVDQGNMGMGGDDAMQEAAIVALRDAAASIATGFERAPGVKNLLKTKSTISAPGTIP